MHRHTERVVGEGFHPWLEKFQGKLCFQGKRKLLKNPEWYKIFQYNEKFQADFVFQGKRKWFKILNDK